MGWMASPFRILKTRQLTLEHFLDLYKLLVYLLSTTFDAEVFFDVGYLPMAVWLHAYLGVHGAVTD